MSGFTYLFVVTVQLELNVVKYFCTTFIQAATTVSVSLVPQHALLIAHRCIIHSWKKLNLQHPLVNSLGKWVTV